MSWIIKWILITVLSARCFSQLTTRTVCDDDSCRCDAFTRVICNCTKDYDEVTLRPDGAFRVPPMTTEIIIDGCARVFFLPHTISGLRRLRRIELRNNGHVHIDQYALDTRSPNFTQLELFQVGIQINIVNCNVNEISSYAMSGRIDDVVISNSRIHMIRAFAFTSLAGVKNIELINNVYENIEQQVFKKFTITNFIMRGGVVGKSLPSRFLIDVEITNHLIIDGMHVHSISSSAFLVNAPKRVLIESNTIDIIQGDAFHIATRGPITFRNNTIGKLEKGALLGFSVERDIILNTGLQDILLDNNTINDVIPSSFLHNHSALVIRINQMNLNIECKCDMLEEWLEIANKQGGAISCWYTLEQHFLLMPSYINSRCGAFKENFWIYIVIGVIIILLIGLVLAFYFIRQERNKKKKLPIVLPDGKTYTETEFHIVVERAELLTTDL